MMNGGMEASTEDERLVLMEFRDFLIFMPPRNTNLRTIYSYYLSTVNVNPEGDVDLSNEINLRGLGGFS